MRKNQTQWVRSTIRQKRKTPKLRVCKYFLELLETMNMVGFGYATEGEISACIMTHFLLDLYCVVYFFFKERREWTENVIKRPSRVFGPRSKYCQNNSRIFLYMEGKEKKRWINLNKKWKEGLQNRVGTSFQWL